MPVEGRVTIRNKRGLHARAAASFASVATAFVSHIEVRRDVQRANGKSIMGLMMLAAPLGAALHIHADGEDAAAALRALIALVEDRFGEGE